MTCANWMVTILSLLTLAVTIWPASWARWAIITANILILIVVWTGCKCKYCDVEKKKRR